MDKLLNEALPSRYMDEGRFPFTPFPTGWYRVAAGRGLRRGEVRPLRCFGRDLVLLRSDSGVASVLDAHCPHLGAHLGHGGRIQEGALVCPFHGWRFMPDGKRAGRAGADGPGLRCWPTQEVNGAIMMWFDTAARAPLWPVPVIEEAHAPDWARFWSARPRRVRTHVQELAENGIDRAHFTSIHRKQIARIETEALSVEGPVLTHRMRNGFPSRIDHFNRLVGLREGGVTGLPGVLQFTYYGLGTMVCRAQVTGRFPVSFITVLYFLPIDTECVEVTGELALRRRRPLTWLLQAVAVRETERAISADAAILEHKRYLDRPHLTEADGPIPQYRAWARQFYPQDGIGVTTP